MTTVKQKHYFKIKARTLFLDVFLETIYQNSLDETSNPTVNNKCSFESPVLRPLRSRDAIFLSLYVQHRNIVPIIFCSLMLSFRGYDVSGSFM